MVIAARRMHTVTTGIIKPATCLRAVCAVVSIPISTVTEIITFQCAVVLICRGIIALPVPPIVPGKLYPISTKNIQFAVYCHFAGRITAIRILVIGLIPNSQPLVDAG